jgi:hypothetical protein
MVLQKAGTTSADKIPIASNLFKKEQAIKSKKPPAASETATATVAEPPAPAVATPVMPAPVAAAGFPQFPPYFNPFMFNPMMMGMPGMCMGMGAGMPVMGAGIPGTGAGMISLVMYMHSARLTVSRKRTNKLLRALVSSWGMI